MVKKSEMKEIKEEDKRYYFSPHVIANLKKKFRRMSQDYDELEGARFMEQQRADKFEGMWNKLKEENTRLRNIRDNYRELIEGNFSNAEEIIEEAEHE